MLKAPSDSGAPYSSSSSSSTVPPPTHLYHPTPLSSVNRPTTPSTDMARVRATPLGNQHHHQQNKIANNMQNAKETANPLYAFQRPFINEPSTVHSFVPPSSLSRNPLFTIPHTQHQQQHHQKLFTTSKSCFSSPPCSSRVGVGLQAGAESNLPHPTPHSQLSPQPCVSDIQLQNQQQQQGGGGVRRLSGSSSVFLPIMSMLAASASSIASQQQREEESLRKEDRSTSGDSGADRNRLQCDDLPSPDYLNLSNSHTDAHSTVTINKPDKASPRAPHTTLFSSSSSLTPHDLPTSLSDTPIPRIAIMPTTDTLQQHHYLTPELVAMENGVDPTRLSLSTFSVESHDETDRNRRLDTPLPNIQKQGYAAAAAGNEGSSSPSPPGGVESRHAELSIVTNGLGSGEGRAGGVVMEGEAPVLVMPGPGPMSAGDGDELDRRYWELAESAEDFTPDFADREETQEAEHLDMDTTDSPRRKVRFMEEIQVIPSSRTGSDDDDDLTLIDDSEDDFSDESGNDDNNNNSVKESLDVLPTTNPTVKSTLSEWKAVQMVGSFLALEGAPISTETEHRDGGDTSAPVAVTALTPTADPWIVALLPSPNPSAGTVEGHEGGYGYDHAVVPCLSTVLLRLAPMTTSLPTTTTTSPIESQSPAAATLKSVPPTITTTTTTTTTTHTKTTDENDNNNTCISPRTLELTSIRSQLHYWTETATHLRDKEQELALHIDQLVQVMADVIEKYQETEVELLDQKRVVFELRLELEKEKEIGFASIQEAALSNREKQLLELALGESRQEVENLRWTCTQQQCEFKEERRSLSSQLAQAQAQIRVQVSEQEQEQSQLGPQEDPQENWMDAVDAVDEGDVEEQKVDCQEDQNQNKHEIERPLLPIDNNGNCNNAAPTHKPIAPVTLSPAKVQQEDLNSFRSLIKSLFLIHAATFILFSITILISGHQHHLHQSFVHLLNTLTSVSSGNATILLEYMHCYSSITTQGLKSVIGWVGETVPDSVARAKVLFKDLSFLLGGVVGPLVWGGQQDLRLVRTWS